ncbi:MAG: T9SS type A sorting domain-containing protein [Bacteroidota bacterium]|nr:T9SS type A sorting domain-containing protein [Bacteroidota bacterium]
MANKSIKLLFVIAMILSSASSIHAQFVWHIEHGDQEGRDYFAFDGISCSGNSCTASGEVIDTVAQTITYYLWRSDDGGLTWDIQNPSLPVSSDLRGRMHLNVVQQIDSLNVIAGGDAGFFIRTEDGGKSWQQTDSIGDIVDMHFSDPSNGIILSRSSFTTGGVVIGGAGEVTILTTTDGGKKWKVKSLNEFNPNVAGGLVSCHSYGGGMFRVYKDLRGPLYTTYNNWQTYDSTDLLIDTAKDTTYRHFNFTSCNFTGGDTIVAYGNYFLDTLSNGATIVRSTNGGKNWEEPVKFSRTVPGLTNMTSLERDTVLAFCGANKIAVSTDRGYSWNVHSLLLDKYYDIDGCTGLGWALDGHPVAIFANLGYYGTPSILVRGDAQKLGAQRIDLPVLMPHVYPNPATSFINVSALDPLRPIHILDIYGREVLRSMTNDQGSQHINLSFLPRGIYDVLLDRKGRLLNAGKVVVE